MAALNATRVGLTLVAFDHRSGQAPVPAPLIGLTRLPSLRSWVPAWARSAPAADPLAAGTRRITHLRAAALAADLRRRRSDGPVRTTSTITCVVARHDP
jgi:hypothetical protein